MSSETSKCRLRLIKFCRGAGLDLGYGGDPITPCSINVDLPQPYTKLGTGPKHLSGNATDLYWFRDNVLDFVYSSHLLEDFENTREVLTEWFRVIRPGGNLVLFCPDQQKYLKHCENHGQPPNYSHKIAEFSLNYVKRIIEDMGIADIIHETELINIYSWELVARKKG